MWASIALGTLVTATVRRVVSLHEAMPPQERIRAVEMPGKIASPSTSTAGSRQPRHSATTGFPPQDIK